MKPQTGKIFIVISLIFLAVGFFYPGKLVWSLIGNELASGTIDSPGETVVFEGLSVDGNSNLQVAYTLQVESDSTAETDSEIHDSGWVAKFRYP